METDVPTISTFCATNACVEITLTGQGQVVVRDSKPGGASVAFTPDAWLSFVADLQAGDRPRT